MKAWWGAGNERRDGIVETGEIHGGNGNGIEGDGGAGGNELRFRRESKRGREMGFGGGKRDPGG